MSGIVCAICGGPSGLRTIARATALAEETGLSLTSCTWSIPDS
jgi:hypothetical protein